MKKYTVKSEKKKIKEGCWEVLECKVFRDDVEIGSYTRNYPTLFNTFVPFERDGKDYAFIGEKYNGFTIYSLDPFEKIYETLMIEGEFCPTEFYVPEDLRFYDFDKENDFKITKTINKTGYHAFLGGIFWGNDHSGTGNDVYYINLSDIRNPIIKRLEGIELPPKAKIEDCIYFDPDNNDLIHTKEKYYFSVGIKKDMKFEDLK